MKNENLIQSNQNKKKSLLLLICIVLLIVVIVGLIFILNNRKKDKNNSEKNVLEEIFICAYSTNITETSIFEFHKEKCDWDGYKLLGTYGCNSENCTIYDYNEETKELVLFDDGYYIYNLKTKKRTKKNISKNKYESINFIKKGSNKNIMYISKNDKYALYDLKTSKFITKFEYTYISEFDELSKKGFIVAGDDAKSYIINVTNGKKIRTINNMVIGDEIKIGDKNFYVLYTSDSKETDDNRPSLYNEAFEPVIKDYEKYDFTINSDNTITISVDNHKFYVYDLNGNIKSVSKEYEEIQKLVKDYVIVTVGNKINVIDLKGTLKTTLLTIKANYKLHPTISGWYTENGKNGIYFVVENNEIEYGQKGSGLEFYYIPSTGETGVIETDGVGGYAKPVLYLYPTEKSNIRVNFEKEQLLTTTYPKFKNNWDVIAYPNGDLYDKKGNYYYGLYWEEKGSTNVDFETGFYVTKDNAIDFLEEKLTKIGLNDRERNEFIMYWLPILEKNGKSLVYFELTNERQKYNSIVISPKPDSLLRMAIHVKKVDKEVPIKEQKLESFDRIGYTVVEWGGVIH